MTFLGVVDSITSVFRKSPFATGGSLTAGLLALGVISDLGGAGQFMCQQSWFRPVCSVLHLQGVASPAEQKMWDSAAKGQTCDGYRTYIATYADGEFASQATARLTAARRIESETFLAPQDFVLPVAHRADLTPYPTEAAARAAALASAESYARDTTCAGYASGEFRLKGVRVEADGWTCRSYRGGTICGFDQGKAVCTVSARTISVAEDCSVR
ncbi:hypothetical protein ABAC460_04710 [Asticcacaulis sp. AC460]|uniref:hypothetical protein n=1 Tax=Asticcacaulis sp. AC460 TaxID=1282360 RepID=UPI0003C3BDC3|nr:hypothetical protein [Asticcacaulis sp. AC460]ESQ92194.1 hypothetical protein ABAC460_04710 [Asticcacaulis sp. AC460]